MPVRREPANPDPFEPVNRGLFRLGHALDDAIGRPLARTYLAILPRPVRKGVHRALSNADEPGVAVNDLLQGRFGAGGRTLVRFIANTTIGVAGLFDPATKAGLPHHDNGFGKTLGRYGAPQGPYLYLPLLGPSTLRNAIGGGLDFAADPLSLPSYHHAAIVNVARTSVALLDARAGANHQIETLYQTATDPYATVRSVYLQYEASSGGEAEPPLDDLPEFPSATEDQAGSDKSPSTAPGSQP